MSTELLEAAKALLPFLETSKDRLDGYWEKLRPLSRADRLRQEADEIEAKDAAILRFRAAIAAAEEGR